MPTNFRTLWIACLTVWMAAACAWGRSPVDVDAMVGDLPADTLAYWAMDPGVLASGAGEPGASAERALLLGTLRAAVASGVAGSKSQAQWVEGLLAAAMVGEVPHTLAVLDFRAHRDDGATKAEIDGLQIVLELRTRTRHEEYLRTLRAILIDAANAKGLPEDARGAQRRLTLPGERRGVAYRAESWPEWREVSWCSDDDRFVIALGKGALERWFGARENGERAWDGLRGPGEALVEAFLDLDALRERFPEGFDEGRVERMVAALDLEDASALLVRAEAVASDVSPALLAIDWITEEVDGGVRRRALTERTWPGELALPVRGATYVAVARVNWEDLFARALRIHGATLRHRGYERFLERRGAWVREHGERLRAMTDGLSEWLVLTDVPEPVLPIPGLGSVFVAAKPGISSAVLDGRMRELLGAFREQVVRTEDGVWSLKVDDAGIVRIPAWGFVDGRRGAMLAGGWGPPVVERARQMIGDR